MKYYYAGYGSNMNIDQMSWRCPTAKIIGTGYIKGWKLYFNYHANIQYTGNKHDITPLVIWEITDEDLAMLDLYEGFPKYYVKKNLNCHINNFYTNTKENLNCIVYVMSPSYETKYKMPDKGYFATIYNGYQANGLNTKELYDALIHTAKKYYMKQYWMICFN